MRMITLGAVALLTLGGCGADGGYTSLRTAPFLEFDTLWATGRGIPTAIPPGSTAAGYRQDGDKIEEIYSWFKTERVEATGRSSWWLQMAELSDEAQRIMALFYLCSAFAGAEPCNPPAPPN